jgi:hypothetical protein
MLELKTLMNKQYFTKANGDVVVDLIRRSVSFLGIRANSGKAYIVTEETAMRADLIANYFYQSSSYADLLLKYNGYSNPFSINVGDIIRIPSSENLLKYGGSGKAIDIVSSRTKNSNFVFAPKSRKDQIRLAYLLNRGNTTNSNLAKLLALLTSGTVNDSTVSIENIGSQLASILQGGSGAVVGPLTSSYQGGNVIPVPPNFALENGVKLQNGKIIFGADVTNIKKEDCPEPISRAKLKETLIKNKLA